MRTHLPLGLLATALSLALAGHARAQQHDHATHAAPASAQQKPATPPVEPAEIDHSQMDHSRMDHSKMDPSKVDHSQMDHSNPDASSMDHSRMDHSKMDHSTMDHGPSGQAPTEPREPIPMVTEADRAAAFPPLKPHAMEHASTFHSLVMINRLEGWDADHGTGQAWEGSAWFGSDLNRLWLRSEGEREGSRTESSELEVLYGRSISPWWDVVAGVKQDFRPADSRTWAAFGVQGLAPYKFEMSATAYLGESGQVMATVEAEYELLLTNRLILQPLVEASFSSKDVPEYGEGTGLNKVEAGLRLRYEITRRFAPYVGVVHERLFGDTADYRRGEGGDVTDTRFIAGVRFWF